jgi:hypothetical protein
VVLDSLVRDPAGRCLTVTLAVVVALLVWVPAGPATAAGPYTSYAISGDADDTIVGNAGYVGTNVFLDGDEQNITGRLGEWVLMLAAAPGGRLEAGQTYDITGAPDDTGRPGAALSLWGGDSGYCSVQSGTFTLHELTFDPDGQVSSLLVTFTVRCGDAPGHAYGSVALQASAPPPPVPPALRLKMSTKKVDYGAAVSAEARVSAGVPGTVVSLYRRTSGGADELVARAPANDQGLVAVSFRVVETTTVTARITGDGTYPDRVVSETVPVRGKLKAKVLSKGGTRGGAHLVPVRRDAVVGALLLPDHHGDCIKFRLELRVRGTWGYDIPTRCLKLNENSAVAVRVPGDRRLIGIPIRVRAQWKGDDRSLPVKSRWVYLRFVD